MTRLMVDLLHEIERLPPNEQDEVARAGMRALKELLSKSASPATRAEVVEARVKKLRELNAWIDRNRTGVSHVDDSRDSIYEGTLDNPR